MAEELNTIEEISNPQLEEEINLKDLSSNVIESLEYKSKDNQGNEYVVKDGDILNFRFNT